MDFSANHPSGKSSNIGFMTALLLGLLLILSACTSDASSNADSGQSDGEVTESDDGGGSDSDDGDSGDGDADAEPSVQSFEVLALDMHPGGTQAVLREMTFDGASTTVAVQMINGREFDTTLRFSASQNQTSLFDASGTEYPAQDLEPFDLPESAILELPLLEFGEVDPEAGPFRLRLNFDEAEVGGEFDAPDPGFEIENIDVNAGVPPLPAPFGMSDTSSHETGMQVRLFGMGFTETSIGISVEIINNSPQEASWTATRYESFLEDDLGNRYQLEVAPGEYRQSIDDDDSQTGVLVFAGRIHPDATSVFGVLNNNGDVDGRTLRPRQEFGPYELDGSTPLAGGSIVPFTQVQQFSHPNGADFTMTSITYNETGTIVSLLTENDTDSQIRLALAGKTFLLDNLGNRYLILPPEDNTSLLIDRSQALDAELSFPGALDLDATSIEVILNDGDALERDPASTGFPEVRLGPFPIERSAPVAGQPPAEIPAVTTLGIAALEGTESTPLTLIFDEFDGRLVTGGVLLTLPQDILFDSGSAALSSASRDAIDKIVQITEFYEGDPMTIIGHTDSDGDDASNQVLSEQRAASVVDALIAAGADGSLISAEGRGELEPVDTNDTDEGRQANRRVEVFFETIKGLPE